MPSVPADRADRLRAARGADWFPSWARSPVDYWNSCFPVDTARRELGFVAGLGLDHVRIWLSAWGWEQDPAVYEANLRTLLDGAAALGLGVVVELFDSCGVEPVEDTPEITISSILERCDPEDSRLALMRGLGGAARDIFESPAMVPVPFAADPMVAVWEGFVPNPGYPWLGEVHWPRWDAYARSLLAAIGHHNALWMVELMNEPFITQIGHEVDFAPIQAFYRHAHEVVRSAVPHMPISIGAPNPEQFAVHDADVGGDLDVVSFHSLGDAPRMKADIAAAVELSKGRPVYLSEWGYFPGGDDATQRTAYETLLPVLDEAGIGWAVSHLIVGYGPFGLTAILYPSGIMRPAARFLQEVSAPMKITAVRTISLEEFPNLTWVQIDTDEGLTGLGETFFGTEAVAAYVHETAAPYLVGKDPTRIERHWLELYGYYLRFGGIGAEQRGASAIDIALWDIFAKVCGRPLHDLLGGRTRESVRAYNTCGGYGYARRPIAGTLDNKQWANTGSARGPYEDLDAFLHRADELALSLLEEGFTAMKIWPLDEYAVATDGMALLPGDLDKGLEPFRKIRDAVGARIDVALELHSRWSLPAAKRIARAAEQYEPMWFEDPLRIDDITALAEFARSTRIPTIASELLSGKQAFRQLIETGAFGAVMFDFGWVGGITEARKIAAMADAAHLPTAPHDCTGPVNFAVGVHYGVSQPNAMFQEVVRAYYTDWYSELVTALPRLDHGYLWPLETPGIGLELLPGITDRSDATVRVTRL